MSKELDNKSKKITSKQKQSGDVSTSETRTIGGPGLDFEKKIPSK